MVVQGNRLNLPGAAVHMPVEIGQCALFERGIDLSSRQRNSTGVRAAVAGAH
ncbi:hypothetical protein [Accumulibacter sp.]|uniref:hypothetical protein n=1 Tax=Accumulibacter sp. TaxID=2053492 RepID=UPI0025CF3636|nr:hypothetical protein [Accumulibacter sp.]MCM8611184.1 hypothetical protein [Accumulibacter sp.]MCM8634330.1 hypothetical protein [Accumulibacter sp.]MCM8641638.1 hypothetical protein [Accumulibacter sp.]